MTTTNYLRTDHAIDQELPQRAPRSWACIGARLRAFSLDNELSRGRSPETALLRARAVALASPATRRGLADDLANLLARSRRPAVMRNPRVPLNRRSIADCEPEIRELIDLLRRSGTASVRGVAMVSRMLADGTGPLYNARRADLGGVLCEAIVLLDRA